MGNLRGNDLGENPDNIESLGVDLSLGLLENSGT